MPESRLTADVLVSFCNVSPLYSAFALARANLETGQIQALDLRAASRAARFTGITGLCWAGDKVVAALQGFESRLLFLDPDLNVLEVVSLKRIRDIHSIIFHGSELLVASSGTDEVVAYGLNDGRERVLYAAAPGGLDTVHLNSLCMHKGRLIACMHGPHRSSSPRLGRVVDTETGEVVIDGLRQPHSLVSTGDALLVLESGTGRLWRLPDQAPLADLGHFAGYVRGLCKVDESIVVGRSAPRRWSRSRDTRVPGGVGFTSGEGSGDQNRAAMFVRDHDGGGRAFDLSGLTLEIYDILPTTAVAAATAAPETLIAACRQLRCDEPQRAEVLLTEAGDRDPVRARLLGEARLKAGNLAGAEAALREAGPDGAADIETSRLLASVLRLLRRFEEAAEIMRTACEQCPGDSGLWAQYGACLSGAGRLDEAAASLRRALALNPISAGHHIKLSELLARKRDFSGALQAAERAVALSPHDASFVCQKGRIIRQMGLWPEARRWLHKAVELDPSSAAAQFEFGLVLRALGEPVAAAEAFARASRLQPASARYRKHADRANKLLADASDR